MDDKSVMDTIRKILDRGGSAEVKKNKDNRIVVYEVKKTIEATA